MSSLPPEIPLRMRCNGRGIDPAFGPDEMLYHCVRWGDIDLDPSGSLFLNVRMPDTSVNRSKPDGQPDDPIIAEPKFVGRGVVGFCVRDIPSPDAQNPQVGVIHHEISHDPICGVERENYYHAEIRSYTGPAQPANRRKKVTDAMKTWFRHELSTRLTRANLLIEPTDGQRPDWAV